MDEKEPKGFGWTTFFFVTGLCLLIFSGAMLLLDGMPIRIFTLAGLGTLGLGMLCYLNEWLTRKFFTPGKITAGQNSAA